MAAHTPGPWSYMPDSTFSSLGDQRIVGADRISPAIVFGGFSEGEANARLVAAAPDILAALHRYEMVYAEYCAVALPAAVATPSFELVTSIVRDARAAIARVEGR